MVVLGAETVRTVTLEVRGGVGSRWLERRALET